MKTIKTTITDFQFIFTGRGHYKVTYTSPVTFKKWAATTSNMPLIDATKGAEYPKRTELNRLKALCKGGYAL